MRIRIHLFFLLLVAASCNSKQNELPILSQYINDSGEKIVYNVSDFEFINQLNQTITDKDFNNTIYIANFFFTRCPSICPNMKISLLEIAETYKQQKNFKIVSISIDPEHDTPEVLKHYWETTNISASSWLFLNGEESMLNHISKLFRTSFEPKEDGTDFYHSSYAALVDKNKHIRGFYDLLEPASVMRLKEDIEYLLK